LPTVQANQIGLLAAQALNSGEDSTVGQVIATFPNSFYVRTRDDQLLFITNRPLRSPITVNIAYSGSFTDIVKPLELVYIHDGRLCESNLSIEFTKSPVEEEKVLAHNNPPYSKLTEASMLLSTILNVIENAGSVLDQNQQRVHDLVVDFVKYGILSLRNRGIPLEFAVAASKIIGLGPGFTPSGDDLLLGFLVIYNSLSQAIARNPIYLDFMQLAGRTNWISAKLVDYAQHLQVDDQLLYAVLSMSEEQRDTVTALESLIPRGHTSGIDIATGAVLGLSVVCDVALKQKRTEDVAAKLGFL
jgi:hypothetical protein